MNEVVRTDVVSISTTVRADRPVLCSGGPVGGLVGNVCWVGNQVPRVRSGAPSRVIT